MAKSKRSNQTPKKPTDAVRTSRTTVSGPAEPAPAPSHDDLAAKVAGTQELASAFPFNANKAAEYDPAAAAAPPVGMSAKPADPIVGASTVTESNGSEKVGSGSPPIGTNKTIAPLDRVRVDSSKRTLTTNQGVPVGDNQNSLKAGLRGPTLLEDFILREKITHFDHERIPERIVHARGSAAHGYFECYKPLDEYTRASLFAEAGKQTPVFVRFSTVLGERGSTDTARDVRGFAVKFYTDEGNWDLVGNNIPIFFIQDAMKFPDLVHAAKPEPHFAMPQAGDGARHVLGLRVADAGDHRDADVGDVRSRHPAQLPDDAGLRRAHLPARQRGRASRTSSSSTGSPSAGTHSLVWDEAVKISGADPDFHRRDLWEAIEAGAYPEYELGVQIFTEEQAEGFTFDVLDATKIVPEELVPVMPVGKLVLNRNPDNFFAETEQVAFCTAHVVPGIDFTNDPLLAGRIHSYVDTQISRLGGPNFHEIPINAPIAQVHNNQRDGMHRQAINRGRVVVRAELARRRLSVPGRRRRASSRSRSRVRAGGSQGARQAPSGSPITTRRRRCSGTARPTVEKTHIINAFRFELSRVQTPAIRERMVSGLMNVAPELAEAVADRPRHARAAGADAEGAADARSTPEVTTSPALSLFARPGDGSIRARRVAILVADGVDGDGAAGARRPADGRRRGAAVRRLPARARSSPRAAIRSRSTRTLEATPSVLFDARRARRTATPRPRWPPTAGRWSS